MANPRRPTVTPKVMAGLKILTATLVTGGAEQFLGDTPDEHRNAAIDALDRAGEWVEAFDAWMSSRAEKREGDAE